MNRWLPVQHKTVETTTTVRGVNFSVSVSPFDAPVAVRGHRDPATNRFVIELRYISDEPSLKERSSKDVIFHLGKHSNRVQKIEIDTNAMGVQTVGIELRVIEEIIKPAFDRLKSQSPTNHSRPINAEPALTAIRDRSHELFTAA